MSDVIDKKPRIIRDHSGKWLNSSVFREEAIRFKKYGFYCEHAEDTIEFKNYWDEQLRRCIEGYEVAGQKITQHHYAYLNFSEIDALKEVEAGEKKAKKETKPPDFWDGDYDYYWALEIAENGLFSSDALATNQLEKNYYKVLPLEEQKKEKQRILDRLKLRVVPHPDYLDGGNHMIVGKSRRKGYSFKNAHMCANIYNTVRNSLCIVGAFLADYLYPEGTMGMVGRYLSYLNKNTAWTKAREYVDTKEAYRASFHKRLPNNVEIEAGYMSDILTVTFNKNKDAARGKDAVKVLYEEAGKFPNLKESYRATQLGTTAGAYVTGQQIIFGTGGDMSSGTVDFAAMFYNPMEFGLMPFANIWDENAELTYCGFFHPIYMNLEGFYDEQGNSDIEAARQWELDFRAKLIKNSSGTNSLQSRMQECPLSPSEAFLTVSTNDFPVIELRKRRDKIIRENLHIKKGQPCWLTKEKDKTVKINQDLKNELEPIWDYKPKTKNLKGGVVIFEPPIPNAPKGLYKIGFDPFRMDSVSGLGVPSLGAIYVYKGNLKASFTKDTIVAQYVGRPSTADDVNRIFELLIELYNTEGMHENEVPEVKNYFLRRNKLHLLALQPDTVIAGAVKDSQVKRTFGCHMNDRLKDAGEKYIKKWLLTERDFDEDGNVILNLDTLDDPALIDELIQYNRKGNFDRVMAFMMVLFQVEEDLVDKVYDNDPNKKSNASDLKALMDKLKTQRN